MKHHTQLAKISFDEVLDFSQPSCLFDVHHNGFLLKISKLNIATTMHHVPTSVFRRIHHYFAFKCAVHDRAENCRPLQNTTTPLLLSRSEHNPPAAATTTAAAAGTAAFNTHRSTIWRAAHTGAERENTIPLPANPLSARAGV